MHMKKTLQWLTYSMENQQLLVIISIPRKLFHFFISEYVKTRKMTVVDFLSNMGGLFGLCLGFIFVSLGSSTGLFSEQLGLSFKT